MAKKQSQLNYDTALGELQEILNKIAGSECSIEDISINIARAKELILFCKTKLKGLEEQINEFTIDQ
ncbi:MAG TPA: exodeoxyribonuclease VII small subunit [Saprospiraceae bacterium]|nr:exodeoxyribonuclease VII small subunit [Saprospiraceae bacterium]